MLGNKVAVEVGVAFFVAAFSVLRKAPPQPGLLVLGDMSIQGNLKAGRSVEPLQIAMDNAAKRALIPIENERSFFDVSGDVLEADGRLPKGASARAADHGTPPPVRWAIQCSAQSPWR